jgi:hypothetical protein
MIASCAIVPQTINEPHYEEGEIKENVPFSVMASSDTNLIYWNNPSFEEDMGSHSTIPNRWAICRTRQSPPDIHSNHQKYFDVKVNASEGRNFVGMVVRDDNTFEHIAQRLNGSLEKDTIYEFDIDLSLSSRFISLSKTTMNPENFNNPTVLRIWGSNDICSQEAQLLFETTTIDNHEWERYAIQFVPNDEYEFIILEAYYDGKNRYNGNLMIDNLSPIRKVR